MRKEGERERDVRVVCWGSLRCCKEGGEVFFVVFKEVFVEG